MMSFEIVTLRIQLNRFHFENDSNFLKLAFLNKKNTSKIVQSKKKKKLLLISNTGYKTASAAKLHCHSLFLGAEDPVIRLRWANIDKSNRLL